MGRLCRPLNSSTSWWTIHPSLGGWGFPQSRQPRRWILLARISEPAACVLIRRTKGGYGRRRQRDLAIERRLPSRYSFCSCCLVGGCHYLLSQRASREPVSGCGQTDRRSFFPTPLPQAVFGVRRGVVTTTVRELRRVVFSFSGAFIDTVRFEEEAWPEARFREGRHFVGKRFQLPLAEGSTTVFQTTAASDGLYWAKPQWFRFFGKDVAGELEAILDGTFCAAKNGLPPKPIFQQNHPSYKDNPVAKEILIKIVTAWFDSRVLEYVCRWHRLPQCILACGAVDKNPAPWWRMITDARPVNVHAVPWRVKYITISDLCLMLLPSSLMTVRDLKAAYHLVKYGGCNGGATFIVRWIINHTKTGYEPKRFMQAGCGPGD